MMTRSTGRFRKPIRAFISYRRLPSTALAHLIANELKRFGIEAFVDTRRQDGGGPFPTQLLSAIEANDFFVCLLGKDTLESDWVRREIEHAHQLGKVMIPVFQESFERVDPPPSQAVAELLQSQGVQIFDLRGVMVEDSIENLAKLMQRTPQPTSRSRWLVIAAVIALVGIVGVIGALTNSVNSRSGTSTADPRVELAVTETFAAQSAVAAAITPSSTITPSLTTTPTPLETPLSFDDLVTQTYSARTAYMQQTIDAYTATPTRDVRTDIAATVNAADTAIAATAFAITSFTKTLTPTSTLTPVPAAGDERVINGIAYVYVPAGCFMMGSADSDTNADSDEKPQHQVCITKPYWIGKYEVTNAEYQRFIDAGGYDERNYWSSEGWEWKLNNAASVNNSNINPNQPQSDITWYEAEAFALWAGGRLPTEAEWEYAARGPNSLIYPWGNEYVDGYANVVICCTTESIGTISNDVSWIGAHHMAGNVMEWCADWMDLDYYEERVQNDPAVLVDRDNTPWRVLRGGSVGFPTEYARSSNRSWNVPDFASYYVGMRLVIEDNS